MNKEWTWLDWLWALFIVGVVSLHACNGAYARTPDPYYDEIKALQAQAKAETKAANKAVAQERKARAKACDKSYAARGQQLDVGGRVACQ